MRRAEERPQAGGSTQPPLSACGHGGHIPCAVCTEPINLDEYQRARCWMDPQGVTVAAHDDCLVRLGETDLGLR